MAVSEYHEAEEMSMGRMHLGDRHPTVIRLPADLYEQLATEAQQTGISLNTYMVRLIALGRMQESQSGHALLHTAEHTVSECTPLQR